MKKIEPGLFSLFALITLSYVGARIWFNPFVNDEAYSFLHFVFTERFIPLVNSSFASANNHVLNSFLSWAVYKIFGADEVLLRLPNFLAFAGILFFGYKLGRQISHNLLRWFFWIMLLGSAPILEFFSYARGYGLSFALLIGSIYYFQKSLHSGSILREWKSWLLMVLAVLANLNMLHSYVIWLMLFTLLAYRQTPVKKLVPVLLLKAAPLLYFIPLGISLRESGELYFGTSSGIAKSINSLLEIFFGEVPRFWDFILLGVIVLIGLSTILLIFKRRRNAVGFQIAAAFLVLNVVGAVMQQLLLDVLLPVHRAILHWYLLFVLAIFFGLDYLYKRSKLPAVLLGAVIFVSLFFQINQYNLFRSSDKFWRNEQISDVFYEEIRELSTQQPQMLSLETNLPGIEYTWRFLNFKNGHRLDKMQISDFTAAAPAGDLVFTKETDPSTGSTIFQTAALDPLSDLQLLKRKEYLNRALLKKNKIEKKAGETAWVELLKMDKPRTELPFLLECKLNIQSHRTPITLLVQVRFFDVNNQIIEVKQLNIEHMKSDWQETGLVHFNHILYLWPQTAVKVDIGLYNPKSYHLQIDSAECSIFKLS